MPNPAPACDALSVAARSVACWAGLTPTCPVPCTSRPQESIAVTQNYVSTANLRHVLAFLSSRNPALISGLEGDERRASLHDNFLAALREERPQALADSAALEREERRQAQVRERWTGRIAEWLALLGALGCWGEVGGDLAECCAGGPGVRLHG